MRVYSATFEAIAVTAAQDLFEINAPSTALVRILGLSIFQTTDVGDAEEEIRAILVKTGATTSGNGTAITPVPNNQGDAAFGGTVERNGTTKATGGTIVTKWIFGWNVRVPLDFFWTPETAPVIRPGIRGTIELLNAPTDSLTMSGTVVFGAEG